MADSPPVMRPEDIAAFHRDGAVLLRGVLGQARVDLVAEGPDDYYAEPDTMSSEIGTSSAVMRIDQFPAARSPNLRRFIAESPVASMVGAMLDWPIRFYMDQIFHKPAGELMARSWHQDTS